MTKKDYIAIAAAIKAGRPHKPRGNPAMSGATPEQFAHWIVDDIAERVANVMHADNARLSINQFLTACGNYS